MNMVFELVLFGYFGFAIYYGISQQVYGMLIFHMMLFAGFGFVGFKSLAARL